MRFAMPHAREPLGRPVVPLLLLVVLTVYTISASTLKAFKLPLPRKLRQLFTAMSTAQLLMAAPAHGQIIQHHPNTPPVSQRARRHQLLVVLDLGPVHRLIMVSPINPLLLHLLHQLLVLW